MSKAASWQAAPQSPADNLRFAESHERRVPAWLLSLGLHLLVVIALGVVVRVTPRGAATEPDRTGGIVLVDQAKGEPRYFAEGETSTEAAAAQPSPAESPLTALPSDAAPPVEVGSALPLPGEMALGTSGATGAALPTASDLLQAGRPTRQLPEYQVQTGVFGVTGTGSKFVYVFDRSGSMDGFGGRPLSAAKRELIKSLESLDSMHQFQIIFYSDQPHIFNPFAPQRPRLLFGDSATKQQATDFIAKVVADGGTRHMEALQAALAMQPDVLFFLTDADEPQMTHHELRDIHRRNQRIGASINAIEFGAGPRRGGANFLMRLAAENGGKHAYVDISRLPAQ